MPETTPEPMELPDPHPAYVLFRVQTEALVAVIGRKKAERMLRIMAEKLATEQSLAQVFVVRPKTKHEEMRLARVHAANLFDRYLATFTARLPDE